MAGYSSGASYKQHSPSKASVLGELHETQCTIRRLEEKLQKMEVQQARSSHSIHDGHHSHRPSSRGSSNDLGREEDHRRRRIPPQFNGQRHHNMGRDITMEITTTKMQRLGYLRSKFLVSMGIVILMCI